MMRILLTLMAMLSFGIMADQATAKPLTHAQVETTCGKDYGSSSGGHSGCVKECGKGVCMYDCKGKGKKEDCVGIAFLTAHPGGNPADPPEAYLPPTPGVMLTVDFVNFGALQSACRKVGGAIFSKTGDDYACANPACDKSGGTCAVFCFDRVCHAVMPDKPEGGLTLLAMLQDGDMVSHTYGPNEGATTKGGDAPAPTAPPAAPSTPVVY